MTTKTLEFEEADARFFEIIEKASRGEQTTVARQGRAVARILPPAAQTGMANSLRDRPLDR